MAKKRDWREVKEIGVKRVVEDLLKKGFKNENNKLTKDVENMYEKEILPRVYDGK